MAIVPVVLFPVYFSATLAAGRPDAAQLWGMLAAAALLISGLLAPLAGAWADGKRVRLALLACFSLLCCVATALLPLAQRGGLALASTLLVTAQVSDIVATSLYDAYVERLAPLAQGEPAPDGSPGYVRAFPVVALLFATLAVPALLGLRRVPPPAVPAEAELHPWRRIAATIRDWRAHRTVLRFLLGSYFINDAVVTVMAFTMIYLRDVFGVTVPELPNRALMREKLGAALERGKREGRRFAVCLVDLDGFKRVNDDLGHVAGDFLLHATAMRLRAGVRQCDLVSRWGGR